MVTATPSSSKGHLDTVLSFRRDAAMITYFIHCLISCEFDSFEAFMQNERATARQDLADRSLLTESRTPRSVRKLKHSIPDVLFARLHAEFPTAANQRWASSIRDDPARREQTRFVLVTIALEPSAFPSVYDTTNSFKKSEAVSTKHFGLCKAVKDKKTL